MNHNIEDSAQYIAINDVNPDSYDNNFERIDSNLRIDSIDIGIQQQLFQDESVIINTGSSNSSQAHCYDQKIKQKIIDLVPSQLTCLFQTMNMPVLNKLIYFDRPNAESKQDTKNILRNFGNAQNHYILHDPQARKKIQLRLQDPQDYDKWVRSLKLDTFQHFKTIWNSKKPFVYTKLYRQLCWDFYSQESIPYLFMSRIKKSNTKISHLRQISLFLKGIAHPQNFKNFKKKW